MFKYRHYTILLILLCLSLGACSKAPVKLVRQKDIASGLKTGFKSHFIGLKAFLQHDHYVFLGLDNAKLAVFDLNKKKTIKRFKLDALIDAKPFASNDRVFVQTIAGTVYCFNLKSKKMEWKHTLDFAGIGSIAGDDKNIYVSTAQAHIYALNQSDGTQVWNYEKDFYDAGQFTSLMASPVLDQLNNTGYFPMLDGSIAVIHLNDGSLINEVYEFTAPSKEGLAVYEKNGDYLYLSQYKSKALLKNTTSGDIVWETNNLGSYAKPVIQGSSAYIPLWGGNVEKINLSTGQTDWTYTSKNISWLSMVVFKDHLWLSNAKGKTELVDSKNGQLLWTFHHRRNVVGNPVVFKNKVYVFTQEGAIYIFK